MGKIIKLNEIDFKTNLKREDIIAISELYNKDKGKPYEIDTEHILYDTNEDAYVVDEPVWIVFIIHEKYKERFPDAHFMLHISDREGRVVYVQNDHGRVIEKYDN